MRDHWSQKGWISFNCHRWRLHLNRTRCGSSQPSLITKNMNFVYWILLDDSFCSMSSGLVYVWATAVDGQLPYLFLLLPLWWCWWWGRSMRNRKSQGNSSLSQNIFFGYPSTELMCTLTSSATDLKLDKNLYKFMYAGSYSEGKLLTQL